MPLQSSSLPQKIHETIRHFRMWDLRAKILVAVSGGPDSMALLHLLLDLEDLYGTKLGVAHLNHGLRPEAEEEEAFVASMAKSLGLPFFTRKSNLMESWPGLSLEEAGRMARYAFFNEIMAKEGFDRIATAHHADDQAEQILMNLLRGCGPDGLAGIPAVQASVVRPLIHIPKKDILAYLAEKKIPWREDASNADPCFLRNRIRHGLIPLLEKDFNPAIRKTLLQLGHMAFDDKEFWADFTEGSLQEVLLEKKESYLRLSMDKLKAMPPAVQTRVIRRCLEEIKGDLLSIGKRHMESIQRLLVQGESKILHFPGRLKLSFSCGIFEIRKMSQSLRKKEKAFPEFEMEIPLPPSFPHEIPMPNGMGRLALDLEAEKKESKEDEACVPESFFPIFARNLRPGDRIQLHNHAGGPKKIFPLLARKGFMHPERAKRPVLIHGEEIFWVPGLPSSLGQERPFSGFSGSRRIRLRWLSHESV